MTCRPDPVCDCDCAWYLVHFVNCDCFEDFQVEVHLLSSVDIVKLINNKIRFRLRSTVLRMR